jgi:hypothetical protein
MRYAATRPGPERDDDQRFRWSGLLWWACQDLNLGPHPYQAYSWDAFMLEERGSTSPAVGWQ